MSDDEPDTPETPGYRLWAAMNDAETYEPPLSEKDFWEYAANTLIESQRAFDSDELRRQIAQEIRDLVDDMGDPAEGWRAGIMAAARVVERAS